MLFKNLSQDCCSHNRHSATLPAGRRPRPFRLVKESPSSAHGLGQHLKPAHHVGMVPGDVAQFADVAIQVVQLQAAVFDAVAVAGGDGLDAGFLEVVGSELVEIGRFAVLAGHPLTTI